MDSVMIHTNKLLEKADKEKLGKTISEFLITDGSNAEDMGLRIAELFEGFTNTLQYDAANSLMFELTGFNIDGLIKISEL